MRPRGDIPSLRHSVKKHMDKILYFFDVWKNERESLYAIQWDLFLCVWESKNPRKLGIENVRKGPNSDRWSFFVLWQKKCTKLKGKKWDRSKLSKQPLIYATKICFSKVLDWTPTYTTPPLLSHASIKRNCNLPFAFTLHSCELIRKINICKIATTY